MASRYKRSSLEKQHNIVHLNPQTLLLECGWRPGFDLLRINPAVYEVAVLEVRKIIIRNTLIAANELNEKIKDKYRLAIRNIPEYRETLLTYPNWETVMENALSRDIHIGYYEDDLGLIQPRYINTAALHQQAYLQQAQISARDQVGTWLGYVSFYRSHLKGETEKWLEMQRKKCSWCMDKGAFPIWKMIEYGADFPPPGEFISYPPQHVLGSFGHQVTITMKKVYNTCLAEVKLLLMGIQFSIPNIMADFAVLNGEKVPGFSWKSRAGNTVFVVQGSLRLTNAGYLMGRGEVLDKGGNIIKTFLNTRIPGVGKIGGGFFRR